MAFVWRNVFTYNRYAAIAARTVRRSLKEGPRLEAEKRALASVRVSKWKNGLQGEQTKLGTHTEETH
jgi:F-type H+-transporting ATPase subunit epsilon